MNTIPQTQDTPRQPDRLAAQRVLYADAKLILALQMVLAVPCAIGQSTIIAIYPQYKSYSVAWSVFVSLLDLLLLTTLANNRYVLPHPGGEQNGNKPPRRRLVALSCARILPSNTVERLWVPMRTLV